MISPDESNNFDVVDDDWDCPQSLAASPAGRCSRKLKRQGLSKIVRSFVACVTSAPISLGKLDLRVSVPCCKNCFHTLSIDHTVWD